MKKFLVVFLLIVSFYQYLWSSYLATASKEDNYFIVTAYYSPLPDQEYYLTGNYEDEIILNGRWIAGASGKNVFSWMLAAPKKYSFGTKIYLDGLWVGIVEDRGWAIVPAGKRWYEYDRIDVWMWYWDEWLRRALFWGKRKVYGEILTWNETASIDYNKVPSPSWATKWLQKAYTKKVLDIFNTSLSKWSSPELITELQKVLVEIGYLSDDSINGSYDSHTIDAVYNFQIDNNIVTSEYTLGAWSYGPKTRNILQSVYGEHLEEKKENEAFLAQVETMKQNTLLEAKTTIELLGTPSYWEISPEVRSLQKILGQLGHFDYKDTAIFWVKTQEALIAYQIDAGIIKSSNDIWAGIFWPMTKKNIIEDINNIYLIKALESENLLSKYYEYNEEKNEWDISKYEEINPIFKI